MRTVEKRCEISTAVRPAIDSEKRKKTSYSARASSDAVGSSRMNTCATWPQVRQCERDLLPFAARQLDAFIEAPA